MKEAGIVAERQERDAARIVDVFIEHAGDAALPHLVDQRSRPLAPAEGDNCMNSRASDRCGWPFFMPPFSLISGGSGPRLAASFIFSSRGPAPAR